jgi:PQQ-dependent dehydrogenase (methanol/ethanol family)
MPSPFLSRLRQRSLKSSFIAAALAVACCLGALGVRAQHDDADAKNPFANNPDAVKAGKDLFGQSCAMCHGSSGEGGGRGPALNKGSFKRADSDGALFQIVKNGIPGTAMPAMGLSADDSWRVVTFLRSINSAENETVAGNAAHGEALFFGQAACVKCHMVNGRGSRLATDLSASAGLWAKDLRQQILKPGSRPGYFSDLVEVKTRDGRTLRGLRRNEDSFSLQLFGTDEEVHVLRKRDLAEVKYAEKSMMPSYAGKLKDSDVDDIVAYLKSLKKPDAAKVAAAAINGGLTYERILNASKEPHNWLTYWGDYSGRHFSTLKQINAANVRALQAQWIHQPSGKGGLQAMPLVVDGVMYTTGAGGYAYALDAATGRQIWEFKYQAKDPKHDGSGTANRGMAMLGNRLFLATGDAHLVALDAKTGRQLWGAELADVKLGYFATLAPLALKDKIVVGMGGGEFGVRGFIDAYDPATGKRLWRFNTVPGPGEFGRETWEGESWKTGGGATWMTGTYDPELDLLYWGIGNPSPDLNGDVRKGDNLFTCSVVALDAKTGQRRWHFQFTPHDLYDWDANETPMLVDRTWKGSPRKLLLQANRNGFFYVLDRVTGEFLSGTPFVRQNWAKGLDKNGRPILIPGMEPNKDGVLVYPALVGGTNWQAPSYDPATGLFLFTYREGGDIFVVDKDEKYQPGKTWWGGKFYPGGEREWGGVKALDPETGKAVWDHRFYKGTYSAGLLATAGGVTFAASADGNLVALDSKTGKLLWRFQTGAEVHASPMAYAVNGRQYVALASGGVLMSFALPEQELE